MKFSIPKVIVAVSMADYAPELDGKNLYVWVNPPMDKLQEYADLVTALQAQELEEARKTLTPDVPKGPEEPEGQMPTGLQKTFGALSRWLNARQAHKGEGVDVKMLKWYAEVWSQGPEESRWTVDELKAAEAQDPSFLGWMISQTWKMRAEHVERKKKV